MRARRIALAALLALGLLTAGCGGDDSSSSGDGDDAVAVVGGEQVTKEDLDSQLDALVRARSRSGGTQPTREQLEHQALTTLLQAEWLEQEAERRGIEVDMAELRRRWRAAAAQQFANEKQLRRFLGAQTEQDVLRQLRLQELTERIHEHIGANAKGSPKKAVKRFQRRFLERVRKASACGEGYDAVGCGK